MKVLLPLFIYIFFKTIMMDDDEISVKNEQNKFLLNDYDIEYIYNHCNYSSDLMIV